MNVKPVQLDITSDESINLCFKTIEQNFGKLDILINNAGTAGCDLLQGVTLCQNFGHCFSVNVASAAVLTETMTPLLKKSKLPKVIFITSRLSSVSRIIQPDSEFVPVPFYNSIKSATNMLLAFYGRKYPDWKVNTVCPGLNATGLNGLEKTEETDPMNGAIRAIQPENARNLVYARSGLISYAVGLIMLRDSIVGGVLFTIFQSIVSKSETKRGPSFRGL